MNSNFLKLNIGDVGRGLVVAVIGVFLGSLQQALETNGLDFASFDWGAIINVSVIAGVSYLMKNLATDSQGKVLGLGK